MIGYGQAFVIGWFTHLLLRILLERKTGQLWAWQAGVWGAAFMGLNWISTLG